MRGTRARRSRGRFRPDMRRSYPLPRTVAIIERNTLFFFSYDNLRFRYRRHFFFHFSIGRFTRYACGSGRRRENKHSTTAKRIIVADPTKHANKRRTVMRRILTKLN